MGLICILRLICWVVSCGNSLVLPLSLSLLSLFLILLSSLSLYSHLSRPTSHPVFAFLPFFIACVECSFNPLRAPVDFSLPFADKLDLFVFLADYYLHAAFVPFHKFPMLLRIFNAEANSASELVVSFYFKIGLMTYTDCYLIKESVIYH